MKYKMDYQFRWLIVLFLLFLVYISGLILIKLPFLTINYEVKGIKDGLLVMLLSLLPKFGIEFHAYNLQTIVVWFCGAVFGPRIGLITLCIYIILGLCGLPIFAGGGGASYFQEPTFGYLISLPINVFLCGVLFERNKKFLAVLLPILLTHLFGIIYLILFNFEWFNITWHLSFSMISYDLIFGLILTLFVPLISFFLREVFIQEVPVRTLVYGSGSSSSYQE